MPMHNSHEPGSDKAGKIDSSKGYEASDVRVSGVLMFIVGLSIFAAVTAVLAYGVGKVLDTRIAKEDGPTSRWTKTVDVRPLGNLANSPELQNKLA